MKTPFDNTDRQTDDALRQAFRQTYTSASTHDEDAFTERVMARLPQRQSLGRRVARALAKGLLWYMNSALFMWTALCLCMFIFRHQIIALVFSVARMELITPTAHTLAIAVVVLTSIVLMVREMFLDEKEQMDY